MRIDLTRVISLGSDDDSSYEFTRQKIVSAPGKFAPLHSSHVSCLMPSIDGENGTYQY